MHNCFFGVVADLIIQIFWQLNILIQLIVKLIAIFDLLCLLIRIQMGELVDVKLLDILIGCLIIIVIVSVAGAALVVCLVLKLRLLLFQLLLFFFPDLLDPHKLLFNRCLWIYWLLIFYQGIGYFLDEVELLLQIILSKLNCSQVLFLVEKWHIILILIIFFQLVHNFWWRFQTIVLASFFLLFAFSFRQFSSFAIWRTTCWISNWILVSQYIGIFHNRRTSTINYHVIW